MGPAGRALGSSMETEVAAIGVAGIVIVMALQFGVERLIALFTVLRM